MDAVPDYRKWLRSLLNRIVRKGGDRDDQNFKELREEIKINQNKMEEIFEVILEFIDRSNCGDRAIIVEFIDYFFERCHKFRQEVLNKSKELLEITCETDLKHRPLPGTKQSSGKLKILTIEKIRKWHEKFGKHYPILDLVVDFLKSSKSLNFESISSEIDLVQRKNELIENRRSNMKKITLNLMKFEFSEIQESTNQIIESLEQLIEFLVPKFNMNQDFSNIPSTSQTTFEEEGKEEIEIYLKDIQNPNIEITVENDVIIENIMEMKDLIEKRLEKLKKTSKRMADIPDDFLSEIRDLRTKIIKILRKVEALKLKSTRRKSHKFGKEKDDDDEFEDVEEMTVDQILMIQYSDNFEPEIMENEEKEEEAGPSKTQNIPIVPFGLDLKYWGEKRDKVQIPKNNSDCHRFWRPPDEESSAVAQECVYTQRVFNFVGNQEKSDKICRAPMKNGILCPRKDFSSCPLHGRIVERNEKGEPINKKDRELLKQKEEIEHRKEVEKFSRKIEEKMSFEKANNKRRRKYEKEEIGEDEEIRTRLKKKLLDPKTVKRVSQVIDASRKAKNEKRFGHQFSHM